MINRAPIVTIVTILSLISAFAAFQDSTKEAIFCTFVGWIASLLTSVMERAEAAAEADRVRGSSFSGV